jgi:hypothetical protein
MLIIITIVELFISNISKTLSVLLMKLIPILTVLLMDVLNYNYQLPVLLDQLLPLMLMVVLLPSLLVNLDLPILPWLGSTVPIMVEIGLISGIYLQLILINQEIQLSG